jgi:hypothetical protein
MTQSLAASAAGCNVNFFLTPPSRPRRTGFTLLRDPRAEQLEPYDRAVYNVLVKRADNQTRIARPHQRTIARDARCSERQVRYSLDVLEERGLIGRGRNWKGCFYTVLDGQPAQDQPAQLAASIGTRLKTKPEPETPQTLDRGEEKNPLTSQELEHIKAIRPILGISRDKLETTSRAYLPELAAIAEAKRHKMRSRGRHVERKPKPRPVLSPEQQAAARLMAALNLPRHWHQTRDKDIVPVIREWLELNPGKGPEDAVSALLSAWAHYEDARLKWRYTSPVRFLIAGLWKDRDGWQYDFQALRNRREASVGVYRPSAAEPSSTTASRSSTTPSSPSPELEPFSWNDLFRDFREQRAKAQKARQ